MNITRHLPYFIIATLTMLSAQAVAGWEDIDVSRPKTSYQTEKTVSRTAHSQTRTRTTQKKAVKNTQAGTVAPSTGSYLLPPDLYSTFLDAPKSKPNWVGIVYATPADVDKTGESLSEAIISGSFELATFEDVISGDIKLSLDPKLTFFPNDGGIKDMPTLLTQVGCDIDWIWRYTNGWSFEVGATPGIYADIDALGTDMFGIPFRAIFYYAFDPALSIKFGLEFRPGWNQVIMPNLGLAWQPDDQFRLELALPKSTVNFNIGVVDIFGLIEWQNETYAMSGDDAEPDAMTINEWKLGGGIGFDIADSYRLILEGGLLIGREITVEKGSAEQSTDVNSALYLGAALGWEL